MSCDITPEVGILPGSTTVKALLDSSSNLLVVLRPDGSAALTNDSFESVLGYAAGELQDNSQDFLHQPSELEEFRAKFEEAKAISGNTCAARCRLRAKDGSWLWFDFEISNHLQTPGIDGLLVTYRNVTELRRLEAERQVISDVVHALNKTSNLDELLCQIHQALKKVVYAENCFVALHESATDMFHFAFFVDQFDPPPPPQKIARTCMAYVFRTGKAQLIPQKEFDRLAAEGEVELVGSACPAWLGVPFRRSRGTGSSSRRGSAARRG